MNNELIVFTHNDLDALGCMLNVEFKFPGIDKKYFFTNYSNIPDIVEQIKKHIEVFGNKHILIADVSFSDNKESLTELYNLAKCTHIDHHMYPEGFWDVYPDMKVIWDTKKSATLLCNEYFGNKGKNKSLDQLSYIIDIYDLWQVDSPVFDFAQDLNEYFWRYDISLLSQKLVANNYKLLDDFSDTVKQIKTEYNAALQEYEDTKKIQRAGEISLLFINDWFNQVNIQEMNNGKNFVVGINSYGIIRVRINQKAPYTKDQINNLRKILTGNYNHGHLHAFTYKVDHKESGALLAEAQRVVNAITETCLSMKINY